MPLASVSEETNDVNVDEGHFFEVQVTFPTLSSIWVCTALKCSACIRPISRIIVRPRSEYLSTLRFMFGWWESEGFMIAGR